MHPPNAPAPPEPRFPVTAGVRRLSLMARVTRAAMWALVTVTAVVAAVGWLTGTEPVAPIDTRTAAVLAQHDAGPPTEGEADAAPSPDGSEELAPITARNPAPVDYLPGGGAELERASLMAQKRAADSSNTTGRLVSILGIFGFIFIAWLLSTNRRAVKWRIVAVGTALQLTFAVFILWTPIGKALFGYLNEVVMVLLEFTKAGTNFLLASFATNQVEVAFLNVLFDVLPTIIFFSSLMTVLYHLGVMQVLVRVMSVVMVRFMGTSGSETLSASANIFVGQTEAPLVVKPFVDTMTRSELMAVMTGGFATVAGGVLAVYVAILAPFFPDIAGHLIAASVMSAPAALVIAKVMVPETEESKTMGGVELEDIRPDANVIDAAARGASDGLKLAANVAAMLLAFVALVALINYAIGIPSRIHNERALENVTSFLKSGMHPVDPACDDPRSHDALVSCTHGSLMQLATVYQVPVPTELQNFDPPAPDPAAPPGARPPVPPDPIDVTERLGAHVIPALGDTHPLRGSPALEDCERGRVSACGAVLTVTQSESWNTSLAQPDPWPALTLELILGWLFLPLALLMGVPWEDATLVGQLLGEKIVLNELFAYLHLKDMIPQLSYRSIVICTYALCGFANFGSIAIQIGGIAGSRPAAGKTSPDSASAR